MGAPDVWGSWFAAELASISCLFLCSLFDHGVQNSKKKCSSTFSGLTCIVRLHWAPANSAIGFLLSPPRFAAQEHLTFVLEVEYWIKSVQPGMTKNCHFLLLLLLFEEVDGRMHSRFSAYGSHLSMQKRTLREVTLCFSVADYYSPKYWDTITYQAAQIKRTQIKYLHMICDWNWQFL